MPHPWAEGSSSFVLSPPEVQTRTIPLPGSTPASSATVSTTKSSPVIAVVLGVLVLGAAAGVFVFRDRIFSTGNQAVKNSAGGQTNRVVQTQIPTALPGDDKFWLTNVSRATIPDAPATGRVSGKSIALERAAIKGGQLDLRRVLRNNFRKSEEIMDLFYRRPAHNKIRLVLLCHVSKSMELYSRFWVQFMFAFQNLYQSIETFVFSTRLCRITEDLKEMDYVQSGASHSCFLYYGVSRETRVLTMASSSRPNR